MARLGWVAALGVALALAGCGQGSTAPSVSVEPSGTTAPVTTTAPSAGGAPSGDTASSAGASGSPAPSASAARTNLVDESYRGRFRATGTVLENGQHGPQFCLGGILTSLPPGCSGPDIVGWSWKGLPGVASQGGVTWGSFALVGTFDGTRFTLTEPPTAPDTSGGPIDPGPDFTSPCPAPTGGWVPVDPARATDATFQQVMELAARQPGYGTAWIDQNFPPGVQPSDSTASPDPRAIPNDPLRIVVNVRTTKDVAALEKTLRTVWGGNLCVTKARHTEAELRAAQDALLKTPGLLQAGPDGISEQVTLTVIRGTTQLQAEVDRRFGAGLVRVVGRLEPIDG